MTDLFGKPVKRIKLNPSELHLHYYVADLLRVAAAPGVVWWHTPNGEIRDARTAAKLKRMGVRPGVWDFQFILPWTPLAFLELKAKGQQLTEAQKRFREQLEGRALFAIARTPEEAHGILVSWLVVKARAA